MSRFLQRLAAYLLPLVCGLVVCAPAYAADASYPNRTIRWVVQAPPGGVTDILARTVAAGMQKRLGVAVVVDNRAGGNNVIGTNLALKAPADGYTLVSFPSQLVTGPYLYTDDRFPAKPLEVLTPLSVLAEIPNVVLVPASSGIKSLKELISQSASPGGMQYGSPGAGSIVHLAGELLKRSSGLNATPVHYKGSSQVAVDLIGGQFAFAIDNLPPYLELLKGQKVRALAVLGQQRSPLLLDVPQMGELGFPGYQGNGWQGVAVRAETDPALVAQLGTAIQQVMADPETRQKLENMGFILVGNRPADAAIYIDREMRRWGEVIQSGGIKPGM